MQHRFYALSPVRKPAHTQARPHANPPTRKPAHTLVPTPPRLVLETSLYADDLAAAKQFYDEMLGLDVVLRTEGNHVTFRCGPGVLHVFNPSSAP